MKEKKCKAIFNPLQIYNCILLLMNDFWTILVAISIPEWEPKSEVIKCSRKP